MPQIMLYLKPEQDIKVDKLKKIWKMTKIDIIQKLIEDKLNELTPGLNQENAI